MEKTDVPEAQLTEVEQVFPQLLTAADELSQARSKRKFKEVVFPYYRAVNGIEYDVLIKIDPTQYGPTKYNIDIGKFEPTGFTSQGIFDFRLLQDKKHDGRVSLYGYSDMQYMISQGKMVKRPDELDKEALFVSKDLRGSGIGKALRSIARVILNEDNIQTIVGGEAISLDAAHPLGQFHRQTKAHLFRVETPDLPGIYGSRQDDYKGNRVAFPTRQSARFPYQFP